MALVVQTIGTALGRDFSTLAGWGAALPANLVTDGNSYEGDCYNDSEFVQGPNQLTLAGNTTDATHTITLTTGPGQSFRDNPNAQLNRLDYVPANGVAITTTDPYVDTITIRTGDTVVRGLQLQNTRGSSCLDLDGQDRVIGEDCIIKSGGDRPLRIIGLFNAIPPIARNCLIISAGPTATAVFSVGTVEAYFLTIVCPSDTPSANRALFFAYSGASVLENCAVFGFATMTNTTVGVTFVTCATDDPAPPAGFLGPFVYANQFHNTTDAAGDWAEKDGADLLGAATPDAPNGAEDIVKTTRPQKGLWDIGAWELRTASDVQVFVTVVT